LEHRINAFLGLSRRAWHRAKEEVECLVSLGANRLCASTKKCQCGMNGFHL
jgi:hypothetical protein